MQLVRYESSSQYGTFGVLLNEGEWLCHTLEPSNRAGGANQAIKAGSYELNFEWSPKFQRNLPTIIVPHRKYLRIHVGNVVSETRGCVLVGKERGRSMVLRSRQALNELIDYIKEHNIKHIDIIDYERLSF